MTKGQRTVTTLLAVIVVLLVGCSWSPGGGIHWDKPWSDNAAYVDDPLMSSSWRSSWQMIGFSPNISASDFCPIIVNGVDICKP